MGMERCVTALPCIQETCSWKVQDARCLLSDGLTTCHSDSPLLRSGCWALCSGPLQEGRSDDHAPRLKCDGEEKQLMQESLTSTLVLGTMLW